MAVEMWLAFVAASAALLVLPGPTVLLVVSYALSHGRRAMAATVVGVALGDLTAMTLSLAGLGMVLAASATLFTVLKWIGAAYLVHLGIRMWRSPVADGEGAGSPVVPGMGEAGADGGIGGAPPALRSVVLRLWLVTALNPKGLVFFVAFLPQFLSPDRPLPGQVAILEATFVSLAVVNAVLYGLLASGIRDRLRRPATRRAINRVGGTALVSAGVLTAA